MNDPSAELRQFLVARGASIAGHADLSELAAAQTSGYQSGVSIAVALAPGAVRAVAPGPGYWLSSMACVILYMLS
jgi:hypothetical protein